jgi:hypothetical protein
VFIFSHGYFLLLETNLVINLTMGIAVAPLLMAVAADSTLSATSAARLKTRIKKIRATLKIIKNTAKTALTMISKTSAAVSIITV